MSIDQAALSAQVADRRYWAAVFDVWALPLLIGVLAHFLADGRFDHDALWFAVAVVVLVVAEALTGRTPGKKMLGLRVERTDGSSIGWQTALRRRLWMLPGLLGLIPGVRHDVAELLVLVSASSVMISMSRSASGRGWHEWISATRVTPAGKWTNHVRPRQESNLRRTV